jgi:glycosyltransferase involved in cell wall biosynthesis
MQRLRVLQGFIDIGGQGSRYCQAIKEQGHYSASWFYDRTLKSEPFDRLLDFSGSGLWSGRIRKTGYLIDALLHFDVWHIHKGFSMFSQGRDLALARKLGKKIVIHYRGREIRPEMGMTKLPAHIVEKVRREADIASKILVKDGQLAELLQPYVRDFVVFPNIVKVDHMCLSEASSSPAEKDRIRIVHIPSNPAYKGTGYIRQAIERLGDRVEYVELLKLPHVEVLKHFSDADIVIDQLLTGTYGNTSLEAMALGKCVVNFLHSDFIRYEPEVPPIVPSTKEGLYDTLSALIDNRELIFNLGKLGTEFIRRYHSSKEVGVKLVQLYRGLA